MSAMRHFLEFERPIAELEEQIVQLRRLSESQESVGIDDEVVKLQAKADRLLHQTYARLTPWQKTQVARHPDRPHFMDYRERLLEDYQPLCGDRLFAEDAAIQGGLGRFRGRSVMLIGQEKGADTASRVKHNFGMALPEGYRKVQRLMRLAERFGIPVVTLVDTAGAYPGIEAEARGQGEAIARSLETCLSLRAPIVSVVIGEGGSGGAIALAAANHVLMLEHAIYSVISPEGCASILWRSGEHARDAAEALKLTAQDLIKHQVIDAIISEPMGGAHRDKDVTIAAVGDAIETSLDALRDLDPDGLRTARRNKFLELGRMAPV